jgi:hypothetical protein
MIVSVDCEQSAHGPPFGKRCLYSRSDDQQRPRSDIHMKKFIAQQARVLLSSFIAGTPHWPWKKAHYVKGGVLPVHRPLPYERVWRVVYQDHVLHTTPEIDELMQSRYGQCVGNVPDPLIPSYTLVHQHYIAHSLAHRCKHRRRQLHDGRRVNPPVPSEQRLSPIVDLHRHRDIRKWPELSFCVGRHACSGSE